MKNNEVISEIIRNYKGYLNFSTPKSDKYGTQICALLNEGEQFKVMKAGMCARLSHESFFNAMLPNDIKLLRKLIKAGDEHSKAVRGIKYTFILTAPRYIWAEMDTYIVGREPLGSTSTMHKEAKNLTGDELIEAKSKITEDTLQTRCFDISIQSMHRIIKQRKSHRLPQWKTICDYFESFGCYKWLYGE